jgi:hypothetical protein
MRCLVNCSVNTSPRQRPTLEVLLRDSDFRWVHPDAFNLSYVYNYITKLCSNKQKSYKIMRMNMFAVYEKAKPDVDHIRGLNLAVVKLTTVQATKLPL